jgi:hypothetical protein
MRETAKQKARREATLAETTNQVNNLISEFFILLSLLHKAQERAGKHPIANQVRQRAFERHNHPQANCAS